jgi:16S rRNA (uracil1498-N3)-methyltransferase
MSQIFRLYEHQKFEEKSMVSITGDSHHIVSRVLRMNPGDILELLNGEGDIAKAEIVSLDKKNLQLGVGAVKHLPRPSPAISLFMGSLKGDKLAWVAQKVTELGVEELGFFDSDHSIAVKSENTLEKTGKTLIEALRQSGNPYLPRLKLYKNLEQIKKNESSNHWEIVLDEKEKEPFSKMISLGKPAGISLFIGPEGGFSDKEREFFRNRGCHSVTIAPYVLRADTAAVAAVGLCRAAFN